MKCDNLKAYVDRELGLLHRMIMAAHVRMCVQCRSSMAEWQRLSCEVEQLEDAPVPPALRGKLMADAMTAAAEARARIASPAPERKRALGVWNMRKALVAGVIAVALLAAGFWLVPRQQDGSAIAAMAKAMAKVDSVHFTGFALDANGSRRKLEGWVKGANKIRIRVDGVSDVADDGKRLVAVEWGDLRKVTIRSSGALPGLAKGLTYLDLFNGPGSLRSAIETNGAQVIEMRAITLRDGRKGRVAELESDSGERMRIFMDAGTCLLARAETYSRSGKLVEAIEHVEYNIPVGDSFFRIQMPDILPVVDITSTTSETHAEGKLALLKQLNSDPNARLLLSIGTNNPPGPHGSCGTPFHPDFQFEVFGPGVIAVHYLADRNVYHIIGKAQAYNWKENWRSDMVADGEIRLPGEPRVEDVLMLNGRVGDFCGADIPGVYRLMNVGPGPATITYHKVKDAFVIRGTAKVLPTGKVYSNDVVKLDVVFGLDVAEYASSGGQLDWDGLPQDVVDSMKADLDVALRYAKMKNNEGRIDGAAVAGVYGGGSTVQGIRFTPAGPGTSIRILEVPSRRQLHVFGRARVDPQGITVKNAVLTYDGKVLSSEE